MGCVSPNVKEKKKVKLNIEKKINQEKENINNFEVLKNPNLKPILYIKSPFTFSRSNSMSNINVPFMDYKQIKPSYVCKYNRNLGGEFYQYYIDGNQVIRDEDASKILES